MGINYTYASMSTCSIALEDFSQKAAYKYECLIFRSPLFLRGYWILRVGQFFDREN
ncbi:hypothetical protein COMNV_01097 [Commensalibacter sp. Nvir]|uniref:hypothetical protein n=1 Tax=Commensalibacter sp. Nvir TaxID=3069817 RepID=UPI002D3256F8|nr:hypothetical protein COMNV_01097 [Commensalibacter sp. Nvir]